MKKVIFLITIAILFIGCTTSKDVASNPDNVSNQMNNNVEKQITLEDIWKHGTFRPEYLGGFHSAKKGDFYYVINNRGQQLDKYSYETLDKVKTLVDVSNLNGINSLYNYTFNDDETKLIIGTESQQIYRHSSKGIYYVYDLNTKKLTKISDKQIQEPNFSPDGNKIAFMYENNLFYKDLNTNTTKQFTFDGEKNKIINGITDWVYEEEFAFVRAFEWNNTSDKIAFIRFNETKVPEFSMDVLGSDLYQTQQVFKYPKAGENNAEVSLFMYNLNTHMSKPVIMKNSQQYYIPRMEWNSENELCVTTLNRHQNNLNLIFVNGDTLKNKVILNEKDNAYIDITDNLTFLNDNSFIWTSEKDGFNHIYHYTDTGKLINQVTKGNWEVTNYYGYDDKTAKIYFQSTQDGSINRAISTINLDGTNLKKLSVNTGSNSAAFSNSYNYYINTFSNTETPTIYTLNEAKTGKQLKVIKENSDVSSLLAEYNFPKKEFTTIKLSPETSGNMWIMKPANFDATKKYPLFMYQYSGPGSQSVTNRWNYSNDYWHAMLTQKGYIVACVDGRGTGKRGRDFKKITQKELGKYEIEDQINAAKELGKLAYIDENRIGIWGWSFGGYMSSLAITKGADTFKMAIAVAPVTSWRFYDSIYTERYMQTPQENASGYDDNSPINFAKLLKGKYLIIHGSGDDNVHVQNTMRMVNALVKENKQFDMLIYPDRSHGIYSARNDRLHLYKKMTDFIENNL